MEVFGYVLRRISIFPFGCTRKSLWDRCVIGRQSPALYSSSSEALSTSRQLLHSGSKQNAAAGFFFR